MRDRDYVRLRFLWIHSLEDLDEPYTIYRSTRVIFGAIASSFLLNAVVRTHLPDSNEEFSNKLINSFYVDNLITGVNTIEEAIELIP